MKTMNYKKFFSRLLLVAALPVMLGLASCKEDIDESNLYTFTGETIEDFLVNRSDQYSSFNYILSRVGYDKILSAYGTYTCFAPNNKAIEEYIDSLYDDTSNKDFEHNGMTSRGLEGLSDSLCNDIALYHLLSTEVMGVDLSNGFTSSTLLGRIISASVDTLTSDIMINNFSAITTMDNELENGVVHEIDNVLRRSNRLVAGELEQHPEFSIFSQALNMTGLGDSLILEKKMAKYTVTNTYNFYVPEECRMGYTLFAESDETLAANNINSIDELIEFANNAYARCADQGSGWYDYYRNKGFQVSTGNDYTSPTNALNMYVRYHILKYFVPYDKLVYSFNEVAKATLFEYYETMLPFTLMKVTRISGKRRLNRWVANSTLTDRVAEEGSDNIRTVLREGIEVKNNNIMASNGFIHPIADMLVYDQAVPTGVLNERLRFRLISDAEVNALNAGKTGSDGALGGNYIRIPEGFFDNLAFYNGENTRLYYLPGQSNGWSNYQGDEFNCMGAYDFAFRLPPVPDGTYELRMGYTANGNRGMLQFYLGRSRELTSMKALDIPLDMRRVPVNNPDGSPDTNSGTGWSLYTNTDDMGVESDANMHNLNWMRGPLYYTVGKGGSTVARANAQDLRRIITKMQFEQGEYWLRFKTVLPELTTSQFHLDYIELCPENVYNNNQYVEDMY